MGFITITDYMIECDGEGCKNTLLHKPGFSKKFFVISAKTQGWKTAQHTSCITETGLTGYVSDPDCMKKTFKAWFCMSCAMNGKITEWHKKMNKKYGKGNACGCPCINYEL